jgi:hypothetical protein
MEPPFTAPPGPPVYPLTLEGCAETSRIKLTISTADMDRLTAHAAQQGTSAAEWIRTAIARRLFDGG